MANTKNVSSSVRSTRTRTPQRHPQQVAALQNLLTAFSDTLSNGYSDEAWVHAGRAYRRLAGYLFQADREILSTAWRNCYVDNNVDAVHRAVDQVRGRI